MLKFIKNHMETIGGIEIFPIISFIIFFTFFVLITFFVIRADKKLIKEIENLPLDSNDAENEKA
jgi:cbb3-type cytochrome oxidase subunit 3